MCPCITLVYTVNKLALYVQLLLTHQISPGFLRRTAYVITVLIIYATVLVFFWLRKNEMLRATETQRELLFEGYIL